MENQNSGCLESEQGFSLGTNPKVDVKKYILERASNKIKYEFSRRQPTNWHSADHS